MSIRRVIQVVLDRAAAKRVEKDTQGALNRGTDGRKAKQNLKGIGNALGGLRSAALKLGATLAAALGARAIIRFGKESVRVATEAAAIWNRLSGQLRATGTDFADVQEEIDETARALQDVTTVGDEDFAAILTELVGITGDFEASMAAIGTVADFAAAKQLDLGMAAQLVGRVMLGETSMLKRYGVVVAEGADGMEVLQERFKGMAENEGKSLAGRLAMLNNEWGDFQQAIGDAMIAAGGGTSVIDTLIGTVKGLTNWINANRSEIAFWGSLVIDIFKAVGGTAAGFFNLIRAGFNMAADVIVLFVRTAQLGFARMANTAATVVNKIIEGFNKIPGIDIDFRVAGMDVAQFEAQRSAALELLKDDLGGVVDALVQVGQGWVDVGRKALFAERSQESAIGVVPDAPPIVRSLGITVNEEAIREGVARANELMAERVAAFEASQSDIGASATMTAEGMTSAFQTFFDATADGFAATEGVYGAAAAAAAGVGRSIVAGLVAGRAEEQVAQGVAKLAAGTWPPNPAAIAASTKHFAAAALFRAIPGVVGGAISGAAGGGGGAPLPRGAIGAATPGSRDAISTEINIFIDQLSPSDPRFQRVVFGAVESAQERFGENVQVNVRPRTGGG